MQGEAYKLAALGCRPDELGDRWYPRDWAPACVLAYERLWGLHQREGALCVRVIPEDGWGLIVGAAAFKLRAVGAPVRIELVVPHADLGRWLHTGQARAWLSEMLAKADSVVTVVEREAATLEESRELWWGAAEVVMQEAAELWCCWPGVRPAVGGRDGGRGRDATLGTWVVDAAQPRDVVNLYPAVLAAFAGKPKPRPPSLGRKWVPLDQLDPETREQRKRAWEDRHGWTRHTVLVQPGEHGKVEG